MNESFHQFLFFSLLPTNQSISDQSLDQESSLGVNRPTITVQFFTTSSKQYQRPFCENFIRIKICTFTNILEISCYLPSLFYDVLNSFKYRCMIPKVSSSLPLIVLCENTFVIIILFIEVTHTLTTCVW